MGLFSKLRSRLGRLGTRVSSLAARQVSRLPPRARNVIGRGAKLTSRVARSPVGKAGRFVGKRLLGPVGLAITGVSVVRSISRRRRTRKEQKIQTAAAIATAPQKAGLLSKIGKIGLLTAGLGAGAFVAEQIAEKLGVRGGAGFIGKRPVKKRAPTRKRRKKRKTTRRIPRHGHRIVRQPARTVVRTVRRKSKSKRRGKRVSFTTKEGKKVSFTAR